MKIPKKKKMKSFAKTDIKISNNFYCLSQGEIPNITQGTPPIRKTLYSGRCPNDPLPSIWASCTTFLEFKVQIIGNLEEEKNRLLTEK